MSTEDGGWYTLKPDRTGDQAPPESFKSFMCSTHLLQKTSLAPPSLPLPLSTAMRYSAWIEVVTGGDL